MNRCPICTSPSKIGGGIKYCPKCGWSELSAEEKVKRRRIREEKRRLKHDKNIR